MPSLPYTLYRAAQVRELDRIAIERYGIAGATLMTRAGGAAFNVLRARWPHAQRIAVVCGVGNNGGDGFVLARLAHEAGVEVCVLQVGDAGRVGGDALAARNALLKQGRRIEAFTPQALLGAEVIVDALLGTGLDREVDGAWAAAIQAINRHGAPVLALDVPSGLHADSGRVLGAAIRAHATVNFIGLKQGLFTADGPDHCGALLFDDLGVPAQLFDALPAAALRIRLDNLPPLPPRPRNAHKGLYGHVLVIGGEHGMAGAAHLAAEAAARVGAGRVSVATRTAHTLSLTAARPELLCYGVEYAAQVQPLLQTASVAVIGPGLGRGAWAVELCAAAFDSRLSLVVDADALTLLAGEPLRRDNWVLTPHPGEAARLLGCSTTDVQADRFQAVQELQRRYGGVAILKGAGTLIQTADGPVSLCDAGNPGMASAGMGDVLAGVIGGLLAQGQPPAQAARLGVCLHALAGDRAAVREGERGLLAGDLFPHLRRLVNQRPCHS